MKTNLDCLLNTPYCGPEIRSQAPMFGLDAKVAD
jgi:hypothetical protein